jgi:hypothetical protein
MLHLGDDKNTLGHGDNRHQLNCERVWFVANVPHLLQCQYLLVILQHGLCMDTGNICHF